MMLCCFSRYNQSTSPSPLNDVSYAHGKSIFVTTPSSDWIPCDLTWFDIASTMIFPIICWKLFTFGNHFWAWATIIDHIHHYYHWENIFLSLDFFLPLCLLFANLGVFLTLDSFILTLLVFFDLGCFCGWPWRTTVNTQSCSNKLRWHHLRTVLGIDQRKWLRVVGVSSQPSKVSTAEGEHFQGVEPMFLKQFLPMHFLFDFFFEWNPVQDALEIRQLLAIHSLQNKLGQFIHWIIVLLFIVIVFLHLGSAATTLWIATIDDQLQAQVVEETLHAALLLDTSWPTSDAKKWNWCCTKSPLKDWRHQCVRSSTGTRPPWQLIMVLRWADARLVWVQEGTRETQGLSSGLECNQTADFHSVASNIKIAKGTTTHANCNVQVLGKDEQLVYSSCNTAHSSSAIANWWNRAVNAGITPLHAWHIFIYTTYFR